MIVEPVTIRSESARWAVLTLYKGAIVVLPREQFVAGLRLGKRFRRHQALKNRLERHEPPGLTPGGEIHAGA